MSLFFFQVLDLIIVVKVVDLLREAKNFHIDEHAQIYVIVFLVLYLASAIGSFIGCCGTYKESKWLLYVVCDIFRLWALYSINDMSI